jgi:hypothetical protein
LSEAARWRMPLIKESIDSRALPRALRHAIERQGMQTETDLIRTQQLQVNDEFLSHVPRTCGSVSKK